MRPWFLWTLLAVFCWGIWAVVGKLIGESLSPAMTQAFSTLGLVPVILALGLSRRLQAEGDRRRGALFALCAGALTSLGNITYYSVLSGGAKAAVVVPLTALYPLVTILLAVMLLKERLNFIQSAGIVLALCAIYLLNVQQEKGLLSTSLVLAFIPIALWGVAGLFQKLATNHISGELSTLWFLAAFVPVAAWILVEGPIPGGIALKTWALAIALGFTLALGSLALLVALSREGKASIIVPLTGLYPVVSIPFAILLLNERIGGREVFGILLALISAVALAWESRPASAELSFECLANPPPRQSHSNRESGG